MKEKKRCSVEFKHHDEIVSERAQTIPGPEAFDLELYVNVMRKPKYRGEKTIFFFSLEKIYVQD